MIKQLKIKTPLVRLGLGFSILSLFSSINATDLNQLSSQEQQNLEQNANNIIRQFDEDKSQQQRLDLTKKQLRIDPKKDDDTNVYSNSCLPLNGFSIYGVTLLNNYDLADMPKVDSDCVSADDVNKIIRFLTNKYIEKGYITSRVLVAPFNAGETLNLKVVEGFVEKIISDDKSINISRTFPNILNKPLNIYSLDQGLDQANRLSINNAKLDIKAGSKLGGSVIRVNNESSNKNMLQGHLSVNNFGNDATGRYKTRLSIDLNNPFGQSDLLNFSVSNSDRVGSRYSRDAYLSYYIPNGNFFFSLSGGGSYYKYPYAPKPKYALSGKTRYYSARSDYMFYRRSNQINNIRFQIEYKDTKNFFDKEMLYASSNKILLTTLGLNHLHLLKSGLVNFDLSIVNGNVLRPSDSLGFFDRHFRKIVMQALYLHNRTFWKRSFSFKHNLSFQYSGSNLPGSELIDLTGIYAVRGFKYNRVSASSGIVLRNNLATNFYPTDLFLVKPFINLDFARFFKPQSSDNNYKNPLYANLGLGLTLQYKQVKISAEINKGFVYSPRSNPTGYQFLTQLEIDF